MATLASIALSRSQIQRTVNGAGPVPAASVSDDSGKKIKQAFDRFMKSVSKILSAVKAPAGAGAGRPLDIETPDAAKPAAASAAANESDVVFNMDMLRPSIVDADDEKSRVAPQPTPVVVAAAEASDEADADLAPRRLPQPRYFTFSQYDILCSRWNDRVKAGTLYSLDSPAG